MRILVVSNLYPPVAVGGYEVECSSVVERLREHNEVLVLTSDRERAAVAEQADVRRELRHLAPDERGALLAPGASVKAVASARRALEWQPDIVYSWNGASIPQAALRVIADSGVPLAFRVCEHWFGGIFVKDQYMRELLVQRRSPPRALWAAGCRALNRMPSLRLDPCAPMRAAVSWNSQAIRRMVDLQPFVQPVLERVGHSVPRHGDVYAQVARDPAPEPEIVFVGRVTPYKGVSVALHALALLASEFGVTAKLVVFGPQDSDHGAEMRGLAQQLGVADRVDWRGPSTPDQIAAGLARAHALIVPSVWDEPFPLVTIEGALAGVPLVAADVGGVGEGMRDEEHALLFARGDARAAAAALARTFSEREQTAARVQRAHERAQTFRLGPYLDEQERFVTDAHEAFTGTPPAP